MNIANQLIQHLLDIKAVELRFEPKDWFTWTSGIRSPIYCDNRLIISYPEVRKIVAQAMSNIINQYYPEVEIIAGTATAGIPHAAWVSELLQLPMIYVRDSAKKHGKANQIEGLVHPRQKAVIIEDLISTGKSSINAAQALIDRKVEVLGVVAIFSYNLSKAQDNFTQANLNLHSLINYDSLINQSVQRGVINHQQSQILLNWRNQL